MVQISSITCPWSKNRLIKLFFNIIIIIKKIIIVIKIKIIIAKSWKKIIISYVGELEFWSLSNQVLIFNKRIFLYIRNLNPLHLICHIKKLKEFHYICDLMAGIYLFIPWMS